MRPAPDQNRHLLRAELGINLYRLFGNDFDQVPRARRSEWPQLPADRLVGIHQQYGCGVRLGSGSGTVSSGSSGQIAYYSGNGPAVSGINAVPVSAGGTGASTAAGALAALGGASLAATTAQSFAGPVNATINSQVNVMAYGAKGDCSTDDHDAITAALRAADAYANSNTLPATVVFPKPSGGHRTSTLTWFGDSFAGTAYRRRRPHIRKTTGGDP